VFLHNCEFELLKFGFNFENLDGFITWVMCGYETVLGFYILDQSESN
jgi:hypothetical protein